MDPSSPERRVASYQIGPVSPSPPHDTARVKVKVSDLVLVVEL